MSLENYLTTHYTSLFFKMLPLLNLLVFLLLVTSTSMPTSLSQGLTLKLIPPTSPESPFYESLSSHQSNTSIGLEGVGRPPLEIKQLGLHAVKIGIGTFGPSKNPKFYYLVMDTGSSLIWLQCEGCETKKKCFKQKDPFFPSTSSVTYKPLQCTPRDHRPCGSYKCDGKFCVYDIRYADGSQSKGTLAKDKFTFDAHPQGQQTKNDILFGCGTDQRGISFAKDHPEKNEIAGVLGLGWDPNALHMQLASQTDSKFSYCLQSERSPPHESYLTFGSDIQMTPDFQKTPLYKDEVKYYVKLTDISINGKSLKLLPFWSNKVIVDSGSDSSSTSWRIYQMLEKALDDYFLKNKNIERKLAVINKRICYTWKTAVPPEGREYDGLPTITLHLGKADFVIKPEGVFTVNRGGKKEKPYFCLAMARNKHEYEVDSVLGVYEQTNHKMVFDINNKMLHFKSQVC